MTYKVVGLMTLRGETDRYEYEFPTESEAMDYFRSSFITMAESIVDFGGDYTATLYNGVNMIQRNIISTTVNNPNNND